GDSSSAPMATVAGALLLMTFVPVVDTCTVMISRKRAGHRWNHGGTDHIAHRLRAVGLRTSHVAVLLSVATAITTTLGSLVGGGVIPAGHLLAATAVIGILVVVLAQRVVVGSSWPGEQPSASSVLPSSPEGSLRLGSAPSGLVPGQRLAGDAGLGYAEQVPGR